MTQHDEKELGSIARSIEALFGGEEEVETTAAVASSGEAERHPDVATSLGLEDELDAKPEPGLTPPPDDPPEAARGISADTGDREDAPIEAESAPIEAESAPIEAEAAPIDAEPAAVEAEPTPSETGEALSEATSRYLEVPVHEREETRRGLRAAVDASRSAAAFDEIASTVNVLILQGAGDSDVWDLAEEFIDKDVTGRMVAQLGRVRDEEEREVLIDAYTRLGDSFAEVIADTLTDTEDRLARKTYVAALGAFGGAGAHAVEKMLQDRRWFVVRNGVAVLGVVGGPSAIEHLTGSLANEHAGVRRETVRSLAKIGGENAGLLVSSMLGDSDAKVRAAAARAVSTLRAERGYKQLLEILKKGDEDAVLEQVLRALGALGDPSAVPAIEKRMKGSFFSRPPQGVRLAGLTALAAIGTPHALSLVKKARADKDTEISAVAVKLLSGK